MIRRLLMVSLCLTLCGCGTSRDFDYVSTLKALRGTSYWTLQCSTYITAAKHFNHHCGAGDFFRNGCGGALETVAVVPSIKAIPVAELHPGDVIAINGVHVAAYIGDGKFMDSDPVHGGVDTMTPDAIHGDTWFSGKVKILRWKS